MSHHRQRSSRLVLAVVLAIGVALSGAAAAGAWRGHHGHGDREQSLWGIYNDTPAHTDDIHSAIIENPDLEVITAEGGGERRKANTIKAADTLRMKRQLSFPKFFAAPIKPKK